MATGSTRSSMGSYQLTVGRSVFANVKLRSGDLVKINIQSCLDGAAAAAKASLSETVGTKNVTLLKRMYRSPIVVKTCGSRSNMLHIRLTCWREKCFDVQRALQAI